jgi:hypothetical protein
LAGQPLSPKQTKRLSLRVKSKIVTDLSHFNRNLNSYYLVEISSFSENNLADIFGKRRG